VVDVQVIETYRPDKDKEDEVPYDIYHQVKTLFHFVSQFITEALCCLIRNDIREVLWYRLHCTHSTQRDFANCRSWKELPDGQIKYALTSFVDDFLTKLHEIVKSEPTQHKISP
jgi:hypothetical protein